VTDFYNIGDDKITLQVLIKPNARSNAVLGVHGDRLKIAIHAAPEKGAANQTLIKFLADEFDLKQSDIEITHGHTSRQKVVVLPRSSLIVDRLKKCLSS